MSRRVVLGALLGLAASRAAEAAPNPAWTVQDTRSDCSGAASQGTAGCYGYATDLYENVNYTFTQPGTSDIQFVRVGYDATYIYVELDFVTAWNVSYSTGHQVVLEFDTDYGTEANRGDYYVGIFQKSEFNSTTWRDAYVVGGYETYRDANNNVGGANPIASNYGGAAGDGYETAVSQAADRVWARITGGNFQLAVNRALLGSPAGTRLRVWNRQSTSLDKSKLYFHDQNAVPDVVQIDNIAGLGTDQWIGAGDAFDVEPDVVMTKTSSTFWDPVNGAVNPKSIPGARAEYTITVTNQGDGSPDAASVEFQDAVPAGTALFVGDINGPGSGPVRFLDGTPTSALTYVFTSLASATDNVSFSADGGATFTYVPVPDADGFDAAVTHLRVVPSGTFAASGGVNHPSFRLRFRVRIG